MCIDYRDLNSICPKDDFPLPLTELLIDIFMGYEALSFIDGYSEYNQIQMAPKNEEVTAFHTPIGIFCYRVMPFGLKNVGTTYQRAMNYIFKDLLYDAVKCYVDDLVVQTKLGQYHIVDLNRVFQQLHHYNLKMNSLKCAFGVSSEQFLRFVVRHRGCLFCSYFSVHCPGECLLFPFFL